MALQSQAITVPEFLVEEENASIVAKTIFQNEPGQTVRSGRGIMHAFRPGTDTFGK